MTHDKKANLNVVLVHPIDPDYPIQGGAIRYTFELLNYLLKKNIHVTLIGARYTTTENVKSHKNFNFFAIDGFASSRSWRIYFAGLFLKLPFIRLPKNAIIHTCRLDYMIPFILYYPKNPKIVTLDKHTIVFQLKHPFLYSVLKNVIIKGLIFFFKRINVVITDRSSLEFYTSIYPDIKKKTIVMSTSFIDLSKFRPIDKFKVRKKYGFRKDDKILIYVGRIEKEKNLDFLIKVVARLKEIYNKNNSNIILLIVGRKRKEYINFLNELSKRLGVQKNIHFIGERKHSELPYLLNCADVFVLSSITEGSPTVVREAIACGVPVVSNDVGDVKEIIYSKSLGVVVPKINDLNAFTNGVIHALSLNKEKVAYNGRKRLKELKFDTEGIGKKIFKIYQLLSRNK